jgi:nucleoside 2-deoxyribosyltransferase
MLHLSVTEGGIFSERATTKRQKQVDSSPKVISVIVAVLALTVSFAEICGVEGKSHSTLREDSGMKSITKRDESQPKPKPSSNVKVYVASPLGFAESTRLFMNERLLPALRKTGVEIEDPWEAPSQIQEEISKAKEIQNLIERRAAWEEITQKLGGRNAELIRKSQGIVAVLDGVDVDSGTAAEIGYGTALGKWVIGYRGDFRRTGEDQTSEVNLQVEYFIFKNGGRVVHSLDQLEKEVARKIRER